MKRKLITILIGLLSLSMAGIIAVQLIWINNAIRIRDELFKRNASEALHTTVKRLEDLHDVMIINRMAFPDSSFWINHRRILPPPSPSGIQGESLRQRFVFSRNRPAAEVEIRLNGDSLRNFNYEIIARGDSPGTLTGRNTPVRREEVIVLRKDSREDHDSLIVSGLERLHTLSEVFDTIAMRPQSTPRIHMRAANLKDLTRRAVDEIIALDKPDIDPQNLENILKEELENRNIPIEFDFGVFRDSTLLLGSTGPDTISLINSSLKTELYPNSLFRRSQYLSIHFPGRERFIYRSMSWLLAASFIFSSVMLITFLMSILFLLRQKKISEMKSDFINNMTHEFKTPIATIAVAADSLLNEKVYADPEKVRYFSGMIRKENLRMDRQVEDILTIARLEKKELEFSWETFDIHEILTEAIDSINVQVSARGGQTLAIFEATQPMVVADRKHLMHAVFNLLDNANKYSPDTPRIVVKTQNNDQGVVVSVTDNGSGMSRQVQARIFERFYRQSSGNIHNIKGFGLGLSYARAVVESCRGTISVNSEQGKGSTFEIILPGNP
ncbi:MAG: sensor histidine kinase [Bacteroidota bacterium]